MKGAELKGHVPAVKKKEPLCRGIGESGSLFIQHRLDYILLLRRCPSKRGLPVPYLPFILPSLFPPLTGLCLFFCLFFCFLPSLTKPLLKNNYIFHSPHKIIASNVLCISFFGPGSVALGFGTASSRCASRW